MSRTITALFDTKADADAGAERLREAGIDDAHVNVHDQTTGAYSTAEDKGLWATIRNAVVPHQDRHAYEEGIRRGGFLLTADVDDDQTPTAVAALEDANAVDLDERTQAWRSAGWADAADDADALAGDMDASRETALGGRRYRSYAADRA